MHNYLDLNLKNMKTAPRTLLATFLLFSLTMCKKDCPEPPEQCNFVNITDGLAAYYPFNGNANDVSGNSNNANALNGIQLTTNRAGPEIIQGSAV